ncbi:hypothetical protein AA13595_1230 [Gluconacetobacter johannae DSM 13595]|uniref:Uncharacterized protein n=1 Tax=Gluconacetobacter johannae TaxID=112140 RepID=A0A7W4P309_9PROT|nr:hypothetical protein [Gluconacetobacter johannae]MBB2175557.1 hypothetical protein [Gluconacetobacter johannae]GBQ83664.1 hypothetical protein AA13595_1230 [Gluconacetobacter johannae DSM 13595]
MITRPLAVPVLMAMGLCLCGFAPVSDEDTPPILGNRTDSATGHPVVITSDSRAFCDRLVTVIDAYGPPLTHEVHDLRNQGAHLCREGKLRSGIEQLRRALMVLKEDNHS